MVVRPHVVLVCWVLLLVGGEIGATRLGFDGGDETTRPSTVPPIRLNPAPSAADSTIEGPSPEPARSSEFSRSPEFELPDVAPHDPLTLTMDIPAPYQPRHAAPTADASLPGPTR